MRGNGRVLYLFFYLFLYASVYTTKTMNKKNIDRYVVSPAAAAVVGGAGSLLFVPNEGSIKMLGM